MKLNLIQIYNVVLQKHRALTMQVVLEILEEN